MDKLYISDIPSEYHYAQISGDYITLFNKPSASNETLDYYRIYFKVSPGFYVQGSQTFGNYNTTSFIDVDVSNSVWDRPDIDGILTSVFILAFLGVFLINLVTSIIKKGGILGGLL